MSGSGFQDGARLEGIGKMSSEYYAQIQRCLGATELPENLGYMQAFLRTEKVYNYGEVTRVTGDRKGHKDHNVLHVTVDGVSGEMYWVVS